LQIPIQQTIDGPQDVLKQIILSDVRLAIDYDPVPREGVVCFRDQQIDYKGSYPADDTEEHPGCIKLKVGFFVIDIQHD
jgi:hypothetical protein